MIILSNHHNQKTCINCRVIQKALNTKVSRFNKRTDEDKERRISTNSTIRLDYLTSEELKFR